jgi:8-oxo-dGTP pyrophosphatase MutT (NUDIX family)
MQGREDACMADGSTDQLHPSHLPTAQVASAVLFTDESDRIVLVKPIYQEAWNLPGGVVEAGESPAAAAVREVREEIGLDVELGALLCVDYRPPVSGGRGDALRFLFQGGRLTAAPLDSITLAPDEISEWRLVPIDDIGDYLIPLVVDRIRSALAGHRYLEEGQPSGRQR